MGKLARLTRDLPRYLNAPITSAQAAETVRWRLARRGGRFLRLARRTIYGHPASPYRRLLLAVGCELGDLQTLVWREGLEGALEQLAGQGVYLTFDELKGRRELVRGSLRLEVSEDDFDNPLVAPHLEAWSGGSRGPGTSVKMSLAYFGELAVNNGLAFEAHGLVGWEHAMWLQANTAGLAYAKLGARVVAWFHPMDTLPIAQVRGSRVMGLLSRLSDRPMPAPVYSDLGEPERLVSWLGARLAQGRRVCLSTYASSAVRISNAAVQRGVSLDGVCFITLGEPFTEAKRQAVLASGARVLVRYAFTEAGIVGFACAKPRGSDDLHFLSDSYGFVKRAREVGAAELTIDAFLFTSLLRSAPKILLNVESGDYGSVEQRSCACTLGQAGLETHLSQIRSFEKLTGEGMTFVRTDLLRALEEVLPARFGGTSTDYQVLERETEHGILRLQLIIDPRIGPVDEQLVRQTFLDELERDSSFEPYGARMWDRAGTVEVRRERPVPTRAGKILPFHLQRATASAGAASPGQDPQ